MSSNRDDISATEDADENKTYQSCFSRIISSDYLLVGHLLATITMDTMLHSALVPILPYLYAEATGINLSSFGNKAINVTADSHDESNELKDSFSFHNNESIHLSVLLGTKILVQFLTNLFLGPIIKRFGCSIPMVTGFLVLILSSFAYGFGHWYEILLVARVLQGIGSACVTTVAMTLVAQRFRNDIKRSKMLGFVESGVGVGSLFGPSFGSISYQYAGKTPPFLMIAVVSIVLAAVFILLEGMSPRLVAEKTDSSFLKLAKDREIVLVIVVVVCGGLSIPVIEATLPLWMIRSLCSQEWMLGVIFVPGSVAFVIASALVGWCGKSIRMATLCLISFPLSMAACVWFPFGRNFYELIGPSTLMGISSGVFDATILSIVGSLVNRKFNVSDNGAAYALVDATYCLAFILGPFVSGLLVPLIEFEGCMFFVTGLIGLGFVPMFFLRQSVMTSDKDDRPHIPENCEHSMLLRGNP